MSIKVIKATTPTPAEVETDEAKAFIVSMLLLKRVIESGKDIAVGKMSKEHILFTPIDDETHNLMMDILEDCPSMKRWVTLYELE